MAGYSIADASILPALRFLYILQVFIGREAQIVMLGAFILAPSTADAQFDKTWKDWFGHIQGGYSMVQGDLGNALKDGWSIAGGATYKPGEWPLGIVMELGYNDSVIYLEAKYHWVDTQATAKFMPISIGYRW